MAETGLSHGREKALTYLKALLCDKMKPAEHFLVELEAVDVLTQAEVQNVKAQKTPFEKNSTIIEYIRTGSESSYNNFLAALRETNQKHLAVSLLCASGEIIFNCL